MIKAMLFIDGGWLYANMAELGKVAGKTDFQVDFGRLPGVLAEEIGRQTGLRVDIVRSHYFGSYAENYDSIDESSVERRKAFFARLREDHNYEVETFPIDYRGRRLRRQDRDPDDGFAPREKCVDVALAVTLMRYATMPGAMDVAIVVLGDRDFEPLLQEVRRFGKRIVLASVDSACAAELADPADPSRVRDFEIIWLDDLLSKIDRWRDRTRTPRLEDRVDHEPSGRLLRGRVKNIIGDRGYGFIAAEDHEDYFFHANALEAGLNFDDIQPDHAVVFEVKTGPTPFRAGAARLVRDDDGSEVFDRDDTGDEIDDHGDDEDDDIEQHLHDNDADAAVADDPEHRQW
ncbi:MAG: NYN domain-containing protein [Geminicoccaceae bacterium]